MKESFPDQEEFVQLFRGGGDAVAKEFGRVGVFRLVTLKTGESGLGGKKAFGDRWRDLSQETAESSRADFEGEANVVAVATVFRKSNLSPIRNGWFWKGLRRALFERWGRGGVRLI